MQRHFDDCFAVLSVGVAFRDRPPSITTYFEYDQLVGSTMTCDASSGDLSLYSSGIQGVDRTDDMIRGGRDRFMYCSYGQFGLIVPCPVFRAASFFRG